MADFTDTPEDSSELPPVKLTADAAYYVDIIDGLLRTRHYEWARENLSGIRQTLVSTGRLSDLQRQAVDRTMAGRLRHDLGR